MAKPVFIVNVLMAKAVFVVSVWLRVFQKNLKFTIFWQSGKLNYKVLDAWNIFLQEFWGTIKILWDHSILPYDLLFLSYCQKTIKFTNFSSILKIKFYSVRCMKYFSLGILRHNYDYLGPFNLTISCIKVKFLFLNFWIFGVVIHLELHHKIIRSIVLWN